MKPIAIFVWWLSNRANRIEFQERAELCTLVEVAARGGRPVLFASNHLSMFDDPVLPMALYRRCAVSGGVAHAGQAHPEP